MKYQTHITVLTVAAVILSAAYIIICFHQDAPKFTFGGHVVTPVMVNARNAKDPEFFRYPNHAIFRDDEGYYYVVITAHLFPAVLRTKDLEKYEFVDRIDLPGKVAPYIIYDPAGEQLYFFYSDWTNTIDADIQYARLGLATAGYTEGMESLKFEDRGYLKIDGSPLLDPSAGWDPYIVRIGDTYFMLFSAASHGVHLAKTEELGTGWEYVREIISDCRENPALFYFDGGWHMLIGIFDGSGYDYYSSEDFITWDLVKRDWFRDPMYPVLPAGSTCALIEGTLYHLYQVPLGEDYVSGPFSLDIAYTTIEP